MRLFKRIVKVLLLVVVFILFCYPLLFLLVGSIKGADELLFNLGTMINGNSDSISWSVLPLYPTFRHYIKTVIDSPDFWVLFWNSMRIVGCIIVGQVLISIPCAWGFARYNFRWNKSIFKIYIILMLMPFQVKMVSEYFVLNYFKLINSQFSIILPAIFSTFPIFIMYQFFSSIPQEIIDSARLDGANDFWVFIKIGIPIGKAGIFSALILNFIECWNLIEQPLVYLKTKSLWPLSLFLPEFTSINIGQIFAVSVISMIPSLMLFFIGQEYFQKGLSKMMMNS